MMILLHIIIALTSVGYTTYVFTSPAKAAFGAHYTLVALTVLSGTYLIVTASSNMLKTCTVGLLYIGFVSIMTVLARRKLADQREHSNRQ